MAANIKDIARLAGVSHMTVSRVLNEPERVKAETRNRILAIIEKEGYVPSASARALISGINRMIGLLIMYDLSQFPADFLTPVLQGVSTALSHRGYNTSIFFDQIDGKKNLAPINLMTPSALDGLLIISLEKETEVIKKIDTLKLPTVVINQKINLPNVSYVATDDCNGGMKAVQHLLDLNHTKIALLGGTPKFYTSIERRQGYEQALQNAGIAIDPELILVGNFDKQKGYETIKALLEKRSDVTAIFAANDVMALGAYQAIKEKGLCIPDDISVVGFDNQEFCDLVDPPLTTIRKHRRVMGEKAADIILENIEQTGSVQQVTLQTDLIIRKSTQKKK